jgi:hypothetical protein
MRHERGAHRRREGGVVELAARVTGGDGAQGPCQQASGRAARGNGEDEDVNRTFGCHCKRG